MSLVKWEPLREFENIFDRYTRPLGWPIDSGINVGSAGDWVPRVDITETGAELVVKAEIPDVNKEDVKVSVNQRVLTIEGEKKHEQEEKDEKHHRIERYYGSFSRSFTLPENVDEAKIDASFKNGVLNLHIPKTKSSNLKGIEVQIK